MAEQNNDATNNEPIDGAGGAGDGGAGEGDGTTDYKALYEAQKAESRKWEKRSKANAEKAKKYDEMESANKTLEERVASIEADNKALKDEKARNALVKQVAEATGVPESIVSTLSATDEEGMTAQAKAIADNYKTPGGAPNAPEAGKFPKDKSGETEADWLRKALTSR